MSDTARRRRKARSILTQTLGDRDSDFSSNTKHIGIRSNNSDNHGDRMTSGAPREKRRSDRCHREQEGEQLSMTSCVWFVLGFGIMGVVGVLNSYYIDALHETTLWFSQIQEVEREISFRTETGLFYSYYKQLVKADSLFEGISDLMNDKVTEHGNTINVLARMNIYQEVILGVIYRIFPIKFMEPILFYLYSIYALHAMLAWSLFVMAWLLSGTWLAGVLTVAFYIVNKSDTTRVEYSAPLRECFSLPFFWLQNALITYYFRPTVSKSHEKYLCIGLAFSTFTFTLFWQFNQFVLLLQSCALFAVWMLDIIPPYKVRTMLYMQAGSLLVVCVTQFINTMLLGSFCLSLIAATLILMTFKGDTIRPCGVLMRCCKVLLYCIVALVMMLGINVLIKFVINIDSDEHIYKLLLNKLGISHPRDFDSRLYICSGPFVFLDFDIIQRLTIKLLFPIYIIVHVSLIIILIFAVIQNWSNHTKPEMKGSGDEKQAETKTHILSRRPELAFHTIQAIFFAMLAVFMMRMKYLWTPYMCVLTSAGISDYDMWKAIIKRCKLPVYMAWVMQHLVQCILLLVLSVMFFPEISEELNTLKEFWDPDTVELMEWISNSTLPAASFCGSMQLLAGVKLCTGRPITNHPHYEDKHLRERTLQLYQMYGKRSAQDIYEILKKYDTHYIILEDSICLANSDGCRLPDIIDVDNGMIPDSGTVEEGLVRNSTPRFCNEVRYNKPNYAKLFKSVFTNKTFRIYQLL